MFVPEYWGKELLRRAGFAVPRGRVVTSPEQARDAARELGASVVLKVQVTAGKRGKGGGVRFADSPEQAYEEARALLGTVFAGLPVERVLVEERASIAAELYVAILNDPQTKGPLLLLSAFGGMDIEEVNAQDPHRIARLPVDIRTGADAAAVRKLVADAGFTGAQAGLLENFVRELYQMYRALDLDFVEINPLVVETSGGLRALDCKLSIDDSGRRRHADLVAEIEAEVGPSGTARERRARELGLLFIELDGDVGLLANGAGLTMATMDAIAHHGGAPANFLEIGGDAYTKAEPALELVLSNEKIKSIVVNFCGAFARTDVMTEGVVRACQALAPAVPMFFSVHGTGEEEAQRMIRHDLGLEPFDTMDEAVDAAVVAARAAHAGRGA